MKFSLATIAFFGSFASAHIKMATPKRFPDDDLNAPVDTTGANFPCKNPKYDRTGVTNMVKGTDQKLSFIGSAVHGGGSCQISLTTDLEPTKQSSWKVIHSIAGGCPFDGAGNLPADPNGNGAAQFNFQIPAEVPAGKYVLAWTWMNRIGNREFYMNCAPVDVEGDGGDAASFNSLPQMFVDHLPPTNECTVPEGSVLVYPNPGKYCESTVGSYPTFAAKAACGVQMGGSGGGAPAAAAAPTGSTGPSSSVSGKSGAQKTDGPIGSGGKKSSKNTDAPTPPVASATGAPSASTASVPAAPSAPSVSVPSVPAAGAAAPSAPTPYVPSVAAAASVAAPSESASIPDSAAPVAPTPQSPPVGGNSYSSHTGGVFAEDHDDKSSESTSVATVVQTTVPIPSEKAAAASNAAPSPPAPAGTSGGNCAVNQQSCSGSGFSCIDASTFVICSDGCGIPMKVSMGTTCSGNSIVGANATPGNGRRSRRSVFSPSRYAHRHS
jgi:hypothetical protein